MHVQNSPFQRRLRFLLAQEFAARGYYLDVESFYEGVPIQALETFELELLARVATASREVVLAGLRLDALERSNPQSEVLHSCRASTAKVQSVGMMKLHWWQWLAKKCKR